MAQAPKNFNPNWTVTTESHGKPAREGVTSNIITTIFIILFIIMFSRILFGGVPLSFTNFLNRLSTAPDLTLPLSVIDFTIAGSWGVFDFLRTLINSMIGILNFSVYFTGLILNLIVVLVWAVGFLIGV